MSDFRFANPDWFHTVWLVAAVITLLYWLDWRRSDVLSRFLSEVMQTRLVHRPSNTRRWLSLACLGLAGLALVVALMRPQWGLAYREMPRVGAQIMICLDVSKSMLAEDTAPNRLERAKAELTDLLSYLDGDQVGLIAFAGRAAVLCPLTPDFGFFRLILDAAGPHSVGRGGTRLEEPIRKALDGFRTESDVSRVLVLVTDGEDQDSHPLDAAAAAAERGVTILAIGFGDEAGSEIYVTDPQTGARTQVRDSDGRPVVTRLDGETLRAMALATSGAYIPAGTGALDLKSIYDAHIAPLIRGQLDGRGHAVRQEAFQWAVLAGFVLLVASLTIGSGAVRSELYASRSSSSVHALGLRTLVFWLVASCAPSAGHAQQDAPAGTPPAITADGVQQADVSEPTRGNTQREQLQSGPRDIYNEALAYLESDFDRAERMLTEARREAAADGDLRFRATYNLGWVEVRRADLLLGDTPQEALVHLRRSADWFRDAVRLRPDHTDARHNLEVILRRILELADSLAERDGRDLASQLDALIQAQRGLVAAARQVVNRVAIEPDRNAADRFRGDFRQLAVQQRSILAESQAVANRAREELDALSSKPDEEQTPQDHVRAVQLTQLLHYTNRANQRLGQARSQMRRHQAERSFRRAAAGLTELKRARDQLRGPVEVLDVILGDAVPLVQLTSLKAEAARPARIRPPNDQDHSDPDTGLALAGALDPRPQAVGSDPPAWLTREYLDEDQRSLTERTGELTARLQAAWDERAGQAAGPPTVEQQQNDQETERFLAMVREALPMLREGQEGFASAGRSLAAERFADAVARQVEAVSVLHDARERFLDVRGLVELAYARETEIERLLGLLDTTPEGAPVAWPGDSSEPSDEAAQQLEFARRMQEENLERSERIARLIDEQLAGMPPPEDPSSTEASSDPAQQRAAAVRNQFELAEQLLGLARDEMSGAASALSQPPDGAVPPDRSESDTGSSPGVERAHRHVVQAVEHLQSLRRLFFSLIEHLRETAQRQAELNDETEEAVALKTDDDARAQIEPLAQRQQELQTVAQQIAAALDEQANQDPAVGGQGGIDPAQRAQQQQISEQLAAATQLVAEGASLMQQAAQQLQEGAAVDVGSGDGAEPDSPVPPIDATERRDALLNEARGHQDTALQKLVEALALLQPPQQQQQQGHQQQTSAQSSGDQSEEQEPQADGLDPSRLLQSVRDREAQRRREREGRQRSQQVPVERDW